MDAFDIIASVVISLVVARLVIRSELGVRTEQASAHALELWTNEAAMLGDDLARAWKHFMQYATDDDKKTWSEKERRLRVEYGTLHGHLPASLDNAAVHALDLLLFNEAANGARYPADVKSPTYSFPLPTGETRAVDWQAVLDWITDRHGAVKEDCRRYLLHGSRLRLKWPGNGSGNGGRRRAPTTSGEGSGSAT